MKKIVFIAGPLMGDGSKEVKLKNIEIAKVFIKLFIDNKIPYYSPHSNIDQEIVSFDMGEDAGTFSWELNGEFLRRCDALAVLPGWETSNGTKTEIENATKRALPIFYLEKEGAIQEIISWLNS